ncbi:MAG TPA: hypothetical protein VJ916_06385 [Anaerovoracaceae bacterium]|nr:hypothetical protein [Anaerovoracaceae bacterium]
MPLAILGFIFLAGVFIYYLISTSNSKDKDSTDYDEEIFYQEDDNKDNVIIFPSDVEKEKKKRNIGKK